MSMQQAVEEENWGGKKNLSGHFNVNAHTFAYIDILV